MSEEYTIETLVKGIAIAVGIVFVAIMLFNLPEMIEIVKTEGIFYE